MAPTVVASGREAMRVLDTAQREGLLFALAIIDGQMPGLDGFGLVRHIKADGRFRALPIIMLISARSDDVAKCRQLGIGTHITKPIKQSDLLDGIMALLYEPGGRDIADAEGNAARPPDRRLRILVAEDNPVNRTLAVRALEKRGHQVKTAANGRVALDVLKRAGYGAFDVVLMDVQMPEIDGLSATVTIRQRERRSGGHLPIIAMTAHAMSGDRERCLAAGMDSYLSKPVRPVELVEMVERAAGPAAAVASAPADAGPNHSAEGFARSDDNVALPIPSSEPPVLPAEPLASAVVFDADRALARLGGDRRLMRELITIFSADAPGLLSRIEEAAARKDAEGLRRAAHALKGSLGIIDAQRAHAAAARLEQSARIGDLDAAAAQVGQLAIELSALRKALSPSAPSRRRTTRRAGARRNPSKKGAQDATHSARRKHPRRRR
jgi:two-component system sensor histidine kinase/response regulator